jgi:anti-anti-sigma regulatory factor
MTLRVQKSDERNRVVLRLIGRIQIDQVSELEALLASVTDRQSAVLDLRDVKLVDRDAVLFLARTESAGAELRNCTAFIRQWISQERNEIRRAKAEHQEL